MIALPDCGLPVFSGSKNHFSDYGIKTTDVTFGVSVRPDRVWRFASTGTLQSMNPGFLFLGELHPRMAIPITVYVPLCRNTQWW